MAGTFWIEPVTLVPRPASAAKQGTFARQKNCKVMNEQSESNAPRVLLTVEQTFTIEGRGVFLLPKLEPIGDERFAAGDAIRIQRPDGTYLDTVMQGVEFMTTSNDSFLVILLPKNIQQSDVPVGSDVWST